MASKFVVVEMVVELDEEVPTMAKLDELLYSKLQGEFNVVSYGSHYEEEEKS